MKLFKKLMDFHETLIFDYFDNLGKFDNFGVIGHYWKFCGVLDNLIFVGFFETSWII